MTQINSRKLEVDPQSKIETFTNYRFHSFRFTKGLGGRWRSWIMKHFGQNSKKVGFEKDMRTAVRIAHALTTQFMVTRT